DSGNDNTGQFAIGLSNQPVEAPITVPIGSKTAGFLGPLGDVDEFQVSSATGTSISLFVNAESGLDTDLTVLRPDGSVIASATSGTDSSLSFVPVAGTVYTVRV